MTWHLKHQLFHGVCKNIRDSIRYLHSNPQTTYSQWMVTACKAESEMEEANNKVKARSAAATEAMDSSKELGDQIARLMATLTRAEQGNCPASAPNSPRHRGHGRGRWIGILLPAPAPTMGRLAWVKLPLLTAPPLQVRWTLFLREGWTPKHQMLPKMVTKTPETPTHYSVSDVRAGVTWLGSVLLQPRH